MATWHTNLYKSNNWWL